MESLSSGQNEIMFQVKEMFNQLSTRVETIASKSAANFEGEGSGLRRVTDSGGSHRVNSSSYLSYAEHNSSLKFMSLPEKPVISWHEFKDGLNSRYGPDQFFDFFCELTKLQQTGTVQEYQTRFEKLLAKAGLLPQGRQVSCFISGLRDSIRADVQANKPVTLTSAIGLARLYEARNMSLRPANSPTLEPDPNSSEMVTACLDEEDGDLIMDEDGNN
ncbi:hypothetical protein POM88_050508 [Heracleum sosnowskyi]|uniref:Retrotransposon gag domain-containing protein n=1 Tax=Heracleum sosnowskyi TaxID=360622 RepID=A0AAD8H068_9APIA|nr:hypothetical protein POM88_050508 [Heracleum sosnowskyi]